jgi:hypothetical protein
LELLLFIVAYSIVLAFRRWTWVIAHFFV